ncbi:hypothetical protein [Phocaeicola paurosaccharolyticus]|uniref:hypothetical protein n=1 Tax=Phocaeicola paurosaccharolyticus TaxID=732242 RepID=UPI002FE407A7
MMANKDYLLGSISEFNQLFHSDKEFAAYAEQVYGYLDRMKRHTIIKLEGDSKHLPWLIKITHAFLHEGRHWMEYSFNDDITKFRRE